MQGVLVGGTGESAGAGLGSHGELAAEGESHESIIAPAGAGFEGLGIVSIGLKSMELGAGGDSAGALADELLHNGIENG